MGGTSKVQVQIFFSRPVLAESSAKKGKLEPAHFNSPKALDSLDFLWDPSAASSARQHRSQLRDQYRPQDVDDRDPADEGPRLLL